MVKDKFDDEARLRPTNRELPHPSRIIAAGIKTRAAIDWLDQQRPPQPRPRPNNEIGDAVDEQLKAERKMQVAGLHEELTDKGKKLMMDFKTVNTRSKRTRGFER